MDPRQIAKKTLDKTRHAIKSSIIFFLQFQLQQRSRISGEQATWLSFCSNGILEQWRRDRLEGMLKDRPVAARHLYS
jgi:hypothetical protein